MDRNKAEEIIQLRASTSSLNMDSATSGTFAVREGDHLDIPNRTCLPYTHIQALGMGGSAFVEKVQDKTNGEVFALKHFRRYHGPNINEFKRGFRNEVDILRRLYPHPHIIRAFATWACGRELGIVLTPVADSGDLACYLQTILDLGNPPTTEQCTVLNHAFGCLASGLAFIHKQTIRHKDIKPQNILIHQGCVIYTDFGIALDTSQLDNTTTDGTAQAFTFRYCAPEVAQSDKRNTKSDVFSLGCVFTEILSVLEPQIQLPQLGRTAYHKAIEELQDILNHSKQGSPQRSQLFHACLNMLERRPQDRISAEELVKELDLLRKPKGNLIFEYFCNACAPVKERGGADIATPLHGELGKPIPIESHLPSVSHINTDGVPQKGKHQDPFSSTTIYADQQVRHETQGGAEVQKHREPLVQIIKHPSIQSSNVVFSPDDKLLAFGLYDGTVELWDLTSTTIALRSRLKVHSNWVWDVAFSPDGKLLALGSDDGTVRLWDLTTPALHSLLQGHSSRVFCVAFSPDGKLLASGSHDGTVRLWDLATATGLQHGQFDVHLDWILGMAFLPDSKLVICGTNDGKVRLWGFTTATEVQQNLFKGYSDGTICVAFSPDGKMLASGSRDGTVGLWDLTTPALHNLLQGHSSRVFCVAFSPDGKLLAFGSEDGTVGLWDLTTTALHSLLQGHSSDVWSVTFSLGGKLLASGSRDGTVRLWDLQSR